MDYMATLAATLTGMVEGKKIEHGRSRRIEIDGGWHAVSKDSACFSGQRDASPFTVTPTVGADRAGSRFNKGIACSCRSERSSTDLVRRPQAVAPMKIENC